MCLDADRTTHRTKNLEEKSHLTVIGVLRKIDSASVLFSGFCSRASCRSRSFALAADWAHELNDVYLIAWPLVC